MVGEILKLKSNREASLLKYFDLGNFQSKAVVVILML